MSNIIRIYNKNREKANDELINKYKIDAQYCMRTIKNNEKSILFKIFLINSVNLILLILVVAKMLHLFIIIIYMIMNFILFFLILFNKHQIKTYESMYNENMRAIKYVKQDSDNLG